MSWERSNAVREGKKEFVFHSCVHATSSKTPVTPVSLVSALLSVKKDIIQMENGNCTINLDTQLHEHNNIALLTYFPTIYIISSEIIFIRNPAW